MRIRAWAILGGLLLALVPAIGSAQDRPVHVTFGGGPTFMAGELGDHFQTGWGPAIGVDVAIGERTAVQFEYAYRRFSINDSLDAAAGVLDANHQTHQLAFNLVASLNPPEDALRVYVVAGPGMYYREVEITKYEGTGVICDPYWYVCGVYPVESVLGSRGGWDFGFNFGGGVAISLGDEAEFFIESRYHYVWGPEISSNTVQPVANGSDGTTTNGQYIPLTFGFRF